MTTISPLQINESTTNTFAVSDSNSGSNYYYDFYIDTTDTGDNSNDYGIISSFNGLNKTFTFQSNNNISFGSSSSVIQSISYKIYDDYPFLTSIISPLPTPITFIINNINNLPSAFIEVVDNSGNIYVDSTGTSVRDVSEDIVLKADISGITDTDISDGVAFPEGNYQWWQSTNSIVNILTIGNYENYILITGETGPTFTITQEHVGYYLYVTYNYYDGTSKDANSTDEHNIAYSGKTRAVQNTIDDPEGLFYLSDVSNNQIIVPNVSKDYTPFVIGSTLYTYNTITDEDVGGQVKDASNISKIYNWYRSDTPNTPISGENNSFYTNISNDKDKQLNVTYTYTDNFGSTTVIPTVSTLTKTPTIINQIITSTVIDTAYSHALSSVPIVDTDGTQFVISITTSPSNNWLFITKDGSNIYTLAGEPDNTNMVGPNVFTLTFTSNNVVEYTYVFTINVAAFATTSSLISVTGDVSKTGSTGIRTIESITTSATITAGIVVSNNVVANINASGAVVSQIVTSPMTVTMNASGTNYTVGDIIDIEIDNSTLITYTIVAADLSASGGAFNAGGLTNSVIPNYGPFQLGKVLTNTLIVSDQNIYYNSTNTKYESTKMTLPLSTTASSSISWLSAVLNVEQTKIKNASLINGINDTNILGNTTSGYYFSTDTAPNTEITPYIWVFDISGTPTDTNIQTYPITSTITDTSDNTTIIFVYNLIIESFSYFLPDNISTPVQGSYFEKFMFVTSSKSQNNISMIVKKKPAWLKIQLLSTLNGEDIPTGIISMESVDISSPSVCNPSGPFDIVIELRDGSGLIIQYSNSIAILSEHKPGNYNTDDFLWMFLNRPDQQLLAPRATAYPCFICGDVDVNGDCTDTSDNKFTKYQLDMRRKVETLKYKDKTFGYSKAMIASQFAQAKQGKKKQWAAQSITNSYPNVNNYTQSGFVLSCPSTITNTPVHIASQSNIPGNKAFALFLETNVPVVNYIPVRRTYSSAGEKYPRTAYKFGDLGFPVGKSGRTPSKTEFLSIIFSVSGIQKTTVPSQRADIEEMCKLLFLGKRTSDDLILESIIDTTSSPNVDRYCRSNPCIGNTYMFTIKLINKQLTDFSKLISTLFVNQIITIFNQFFFLNSGEDYRLMCSKINSISGNIGFANSINSQLQTVCVSNSN